MKDTYSPPSTGVKWKFEFLPVKERGKEKENSFVNQPRAFLQLNLPRCSLCVKEKVQEKILPLFPFIAQFYILLATHSWQLFYFSIAFFSLSTTVEFCVLLLRLLSVLCVRKKEENMSTSLGYMGPRGNRRSTANFMRQFRDSTTKELKKLTSVQFMEVWMHYDKDGECRSFRVRKGQKGEKEK